MTGARHDETVSPPEMNIWKGSKSPETCGGFHNHGGTSSHHPFLDGIFHEINHPDLWVPPWRAGNLFPNSQVTCSSIFSSSSSLISFNWSVRFTYPGAGSGRGTLEPVPNMGKSRENHRINMVRGCWKCKLSIEPWEKIYTNLQRFSVSVRGFVVQPANNFLGWNLGNNVDIKSSWS